MPVVKMAPCGFVETAKSNSIQLDDAINIVFTSITPLHITGSDISYLNNGGTDSITATTGINQEYHDVAVVPTDKVDQCSGQIYETSCYHDDKTSQLDENKYYPWANEDEFWITEWLIMKAKVSKVAVNELLHYIHQNNGCIQNIRIRSVCDIKKNMARVSSYTLVCNF